jgi:hypothetical protein
MAEHRSVVLEGDQTGQELLEASTTAFTDEVIRRVRCGLAAP